MDKWLWGVLAVLLVVVSAIWASGVRLVPVEEYEKPSAWRKP